MSRWKCSFFGIAFVTTAVVILLVSVSVRAQEARPIHVSNIEELYAAVNDPENAGRRIVLAPGTYSLDPTQANGGRLEFQRDMEIVGQRGDADAVVIDAANLPLESYQLGNLLSGAVVMGRGSNTLEWLTVQNATSGSAGVATLLPPESRATTVRVAHIVAQGNQRGILLGNVSPLFDGRVLRAVVEDTVLRDNTLGEGQGLTVFNSQNVTGATVWATLRHNQAYDNLAGYDAFNFSLNNTILINSTADRLTHNSIGCNVGAGLNAGARNDTLDNVMVFEAQGDTIEDNDKPVNPIYGKVGGLVAYGGASFAANRASRNLLRLAVIGTTFSGNQDLDVQAFGAFSREGVAGTDNHVEILLQGISHQTVLSIVDSEPPDPEGTNTVVVRRHGGD
jgi:hypothetical protein